MEETDDGKHERLGAEGRPLKKGHPGTARELEKKAKV